MIKITLQHKLIINIWHTKNIFNSFQHFKVTCIGKKCLSKNSICVKQGWMSRAKCKCKPGYNGDGENYCDGSIYVSLLEF